MKTRRNLFIVLSLVFLLLVGLSSFGDSTVSAKKHWGKHWKEWNAVKPGRFVVEHPTLICLGFEWYIEGDANHNATVEVRYRKKGEHEWKEALPLLRIQNEECIDAFSVNWLDYVTPNLFAGSIMDLEPDTAYECKFLMSDPDGVRGERKKTTIVRTRPEPEPYEGGNVYHVYPTWDWGELAAKEAETGQPAFPNLMLAYYDGGGCTADWWNLHPPRVQPGDTILIHAGTYTEDWTFYGADLWGQGQGAKFSGTYFLTQSGTPEKPIVIKAAGDGEVIFDGYGNFNLFNVMGADYNYFEGLTIRNTDVAFWAGQKRITGSSGLTVKNCRFENVDKGIHTEWSGSKDFYIADNVFIGRHDDSEIHSWFYPSPWMPEPLYPYEPCLSEYAVKLTGEGHVVCHNYITRFHNGICHATYGVPEGYPPYGHPDVYPVEEVLRQDRMFRANDFYNNFIQNVHDNTIEADGTMYNIRVLRNFCIDGASSALSSQTLYGGPAYFIRNIIYHAGLIKHANHPSGSLYYHNTCIASANAGLASNYHFRNNLFLNWIPDQPIFSVSTYTNYTSSDYNGFLVDPGAAYSFAWNSPPSYKLKDYVNPLEEGQYATLELYRQETGQDEHSILINYDIFEHVYPPDPDQITTIFDADDLDFQLVPEAKAVDAGCILPNVNDDFEDDAPDLGALEYGQAVPIYGPRW
jgi:hypothetical protein